MLTKKVTPELKTLLTKNNVDVADPLVQGFLKRYPSYNESYEYFLTFDAVDEALQSFDMEDLENASLSKVANFYFDESYTIIGPQVFYTLSHLPWVLQYWVDGVAKDFIYDTWNFILTGKRQLSIPVWEGLFHQEVNDVKRLGKDYNFSQSLNITCDDLGAIKNLTPGEFFNRWVNNRDGVHDLLMAHKLFLQTYV